MTEALHPPAWAPQPERRSPSQTSERGPSSVRGDSFVDRLARGVTAGYLTRNEAWEQIATRDRMALEALTSRGIPTDLAEWTLRQPEVDVTKLAASR